MKLKNTTSSTRELIDRTTGKKVLVGSKKTIELEKAYYNKNAFKVVMPKIKIVDVEDTNVEDTNIEQIEKINSEKEVN